MTEKNSDPFAEITAWAKEVGQRFEASVKAAASKTSATEGDPTEKPIPVQLVDSRSLNEVKVQVVSGLLKELLIAPLMASLILRRLHKNHYWIPALAKTAGFLIRIALRILLSKTDPATVLFRYTKRGVR